jgi:hypothetical protein
LGALFPRNVEHGKGYDYWYFQVNYLAAEKQVALQIAGIGHQHYYIGLHFAVLLQKHPVGHPFIGPLGVQAISAWQVYNISRYGIAQAALAAFFIYRYARKITHLLVQPGKAVEQGGFSAIGVAHKGYLYVFGFQAIMFKKWPKVKVAAMCRLRSWEMEMYEMGKCILSLISTCFARSIRHHSNEINSPTAPAA